MEELAGDHLPGRQPLGGTAVPADSPAGQASTADGPAGRGRQAARGAGGRRGDGRQPEHGAQGLPGRGGRWPGGGPGRPGHVRAEPSARATARHGIAARPQPGTVGTAGPRGRPRRRIDRVAAARHAARRGREGGDRMTTVIETRGLTKRYRNVTALSDCTITVPDGRISALIGPNRAGKTTLLRLLAGLATPTAGELAVLCGIPPQGPPFPAEIAFLSQEIPLYKRFTADDHI